MTSFEFRAGILLRLAKVLKLKLADLYDSYPYNPYCAEEIDEAYAWSGPIPLIKAPEQGAASSSESADTRDQLLTAQRVAVCTLNRVRAVAKDVNADLDQAVESLSQIAQSIGLLVDLDKLVPTGAAEVCDLFEVTIHTPIPTEDSYKLVRSGEGFILLANSPITSLRMLRNLDKGEHGAAITVKYVVPEA